MNTQIDGDYLDAERYDLQYGERAKLPDWLVEDLTSRGPVLEMACGTGRIAIPLAERGVRMSGIDYCEPMLNRARAKAAACGVDVDLRQADMRSFDLERRFGTVLLLANALWHLHTRQDFEGCMAGVRRHLAPGGRFLLDVFVPSLRILNRDPAGREVGFEYTGADGNPVTIYQTYRYEADTQISRTVHYLGDTDQVIGGLNLRMYFPQELDALLAYNGLRLLEKWGDWQRAPFADGCRHQLCLCEVAVD